MLSHCRDEPAGRPFANIRGLYMFDLNHRGQTLPLAILITMIS